MKTITQHLRQHLQDRFGLPPDLPQGCTGAAPPAGYPWRALWWGEFLSRMAVRFVTGFMRYGEPGVPGREAWDCTGRMQQELDHYRATGDPEALVELANHALITYADAGWHRRPWDGRTDGMHTGKGGDNV